MKIAMEMRKARRVKEPKAKKRSKKDREQEEAQAKTQEELVAEKHSASIEAIVATNLLGLALKAKEAAGLPVIFSKEEAAALVALFTGTIGCLADDLVSGVLKMPAAAAVNCGSV
jgi:hypothetical protein